MLVALLLSIANGLFAMSEIAIVSARKARLQARAKKGERGAKKALELAEQPDDTLSTVQIFITLVSIVAGVVAGAAVASDLNALFSRVPFLSFINPRMVQIIVIVIITYFQLVIGELVPKKIALNSPEMIASMVSIPMDWLSKATRPFVIFLNMSTRFVLFLLRVEPNTDPSVTPEEVQVMMEEGAEIGVFDPVKEEIVDQVLELNKRRVNDLMTPRPDIFLLDINHSEEQLKQQIYSGRFSRYPVVDGDEDNVIGVVFSRDILSQHLKGKPFDLKVLLREPLIVPEGMTILDLLKRFKAEQSQLAIVIDEFGELQGLATFNDLLEMIVGDVPEAGDMPDPQLVQREDGSWLVDGRYPIEELKKQLDIEHFPTELGDYFHTIGGFMLHSLGRVPQSSDKFVWDGHLFEVMDMDGRRVDKVLIEKKVEEGEEKEA